MSETIASLKFYTDTHIPKAVATQLRLRGVEVVRCEEVGLAEVDDETHLKYATEHRRAMVSRDVDFLELHTEWLAEGKHHCGIFHVSRDLQGKIRNWHYCSRLI